MNDVLGTRRGTRKAQGQWPQGGLVAAASGPPAIFGANLIAWYKADIGVSVSGSNVTAWADQSGNSHDLNSVTGTPQFSSSSFNGLSGISFSSVQGIATAAFNISGNVASFFLVGNLTTSDAVNSRVIAYYVPADGSDFNKPYSILALNNPPVSGTINAIVNGITAGNITVATGTNVRLGCVYDGPGGTVVLYVNNVGTSSGGFGNNTLGSASTVLDIGRNSAGGGEPMTVAEIVMTNIAATVGQVSSLDTYFKSKWGL